MWCIAIELQKTFSLSFYKPAKNGHIASSAEAKSTADLEMKVTHTPSEFGLLL